MTNKVSHAPATTVPPRALLRSHTNWLDQWSWHVAFTLDFQGGVSDAAASAAARRFFHVLDCDAFGSTGVKKGRRLRRVCYRQGSAEFANWHYHGALALPEDERCRFEPPLMRDPEALPEFLIARWRGEPLAGVHGKAEPIWDQQGWLRYISRDAVWDSDSLDLTTTILPRHCV